ncbi:MAG: hypothetical protein LBT93_00350 [Treponema sp.]|jgi:hypothetical protein|nr:hypothetical protein [Treponema sp.]
MYFETEGPGNTEETIRIAVQEGRERQISHIVVASNSGKTAEALAEEAEKRGYPGQLVCVTHVYGFREKGTNELGDEGRRALEARGVKVYTASHVLSGAERGLSRKFHGVYPVEIIAHTLRIFGQGVKVSVEIAVMALDGGLIPYGVPVIGIGGTGGGADTAVILIPAHAGAILETRVREVLCKPK